MPWIVTLHEMTSLDVWKSQAWDDWRTAVTPVWNSEMRPHIVHEVGSRACTVASFQPSTAYRNYRASLAHGKAFLWYHRQRMLTGWR